MLAELLRVLGDAGDWQHYMPRIDLASSFGCFVTCQNHSYLLSQGGAIIHSSKNCFLFFRRETQQR